MPHNHERTQVQRPHSSRMASAQFSANSVSSPSDISDAAAKFFSTFLQPMKDKSQLVYTVGTALQMFICEVYVPGDTLFKITLSIPSRCCDILK